MEELHYFYTAIRYIWRKLFLRLTTQGVAPTVHIVSVHVPEKNAVEFEGDHASQWRHPRFADICCYCT